MRNEFRNLPLEQLDRTLKPFRAAPKNPRPQKGGGKRADLIGRSINAEIPAAGHLGLTSQSVNIMGRHKVQGKALSGIEQLRREPDALDHAGVSCLFLEGTPREVASIITSEIGTPTIGIGAGPECDGQILVLHDIFNLTFGPSAKFVRHYGDAAALVTAAVQAFRADVKSHQDPSDEESYHLPKEIRANLDSLLANSPTRYSSWQVFPTRRVNGNGDHMSTD
jgi:3-methyl-2-oxobutanoate hydroxymethyltransferase